MVVQALAVTPSPDDEAALEVACAWLNEAPWPKADSAEMPWRLFGVPDGADTLAARFAAAGRPEWSATIATACAEPSSGPATDPKLGWLAWALALDFASCADHPHLFPVVDDLLWLSGRSSVDLASATPTPLDGGDREPALLGALRARLQAIYDSRYFERLRGYVADRGSPPLGTRDLWPGHGDMPMGDTWAHRLAAGRWPAEYMRMMATFPAPFQSAAAQVFDGADADLVSTLIAASPPIYGPDGTPAGPVTLFSVIFDLEARLTKAALTDPAWVQTEATSVIEAFIARPDGVWFMRAWLQQLIWRGPSRQAGRSDAEMSARQEFRDWLIESLSHSIPPLADCAFAWVRAEMPLGMVYRVLAEASIVRAHGNAAAAADILARSIRDGLVAATGRNEGLQTASPEAVVVAKVLAELDDPQAWFETLWRDTYGLREHVSFYAHRNFDNPAYAALTWALSGVNVSAARTTTTTTTTDTASFWRAIAARLFETQLIDPNAEIWNGVVPTLCRVAVQLGAAFVEEGLLDAESLAQFMRDQLDPDPEHARLWVIVRSVMSDANALAIARHVGATEVRTALELALDEEGTRRRDLTLDAAAQAELRAFSARI